MVSMETSRHVDSDLSYHIVVSIFKMLITSKVAAGRKFPPPPPPGLNRIKARFLVENMTYICCFLFFFFLSSSFRFCFFFSLLRRRLHTSAGGAIATVPTSTSAMERSTSVMTVRELMAVVGRIA